MNIDVITVGGGFAGLATACRAAELGLRAVVLEKKSDARYLCNSRYTSGVFVVMGRNALSPAEEIEAAILAGSGDHADPQLARAVAGNAARAIGWIRAQGGKLLQVDASEARQMVLAPPRRPREGLDWEGRGGDVLMRTLEDRLLAQGGSVLRGMTVESLRVEGGRCVGVNARGPEGNVAMNARAVVIADGGFPCNAELIRRHICARPERLLVRAAAGGDGEGIRMAEEAGAATGGFGAFYGHLHHRDALHNERLWPYPHFDSIAVTSLLLGPDGRRFTDEGLGGVCLSNALAKLDDPLSAVLVFDDAVWQGAPARARPVGPNPYLQSGGGTLWSASTLADLARLAGLPEEALGESVRRHNALAAGGTLAKEDPPRSTGRFKPLPVAKAPFHAVPLCAGITGTMGGIVIDAHARAKRRDGSAFEGLYAAGTPIAGLEGGPRAGYVGGLSKAFILGLLAAEHIAGSN